MTEMKSLPLTYLFAQRAQINKPSQSRHSVLKQRTSGNEVSEVRVHTVTCNIENEPENSNYSSFGNALCKISIGRQRNQHFKSTLTAFGVTS